jgi:hypothetical protein
MKRTGLILLAAAALVSATPAQSRPLKLCGWISNPTPANWSLIDRSGEWIISTQGGRQAEGVDLPDFGKAWVRTNGYHGYGCGCLTATVDEKARDILSIAAAQVLPLATCRKDRNLPKPPG